MPTKGRDVQFILSFGTSGEEDKSYQHTSSQNMSAVCSGLPGMWLWQADFILRHTEMIEIQTDRDIQLYRYIHISQQFSTFLCREKAPKGLPTALQGKWHAVIYLARDKPEKERRGEIQSSAELH